MSLEHVVAFKQIRPGDEQEGVKEWTNQFTGTLNFVGEVVDYVTLTATQHNIPHGLGRVPVGAIFLGIPDVDFMYGSGNMSWGFLISVSNDVNLRMTTGSTWTGGIRVLVF